MLDRLLFAVEWLFVDGNRILKRAPGRGQWRLELVKMKSSLAPLPRRRTFIHAATGEKLRYMTSNKIQFLCLFSLEGKTQFIMPIIMLPKSRLETFSFLLRALRVHYIELRLIILGRKEAKVKRFAAALLSSRVIEKLKNINCPALEH
jgi:hypothetical protein